MSAKNTWWAAVLLVLGLALGAQAQPPSFKLPGRKPDSQEPWGAFLGKAAHWVIGFQYRLENHPNIVFLDYPLSKIVREGKLGDAERLPEFLRLLRPDVTDTRALVLFEIKPDNEEGLQEARAQAARYLTVLNAAVAPGKQLQGGTDYAGSLFLEFEDGGALWQLSWRTPEPGITLYRWSYRKKKPGASWQERAAQREEAFPRGETEQRGEMVEQVLRAAYSGGNWPSGFQGQVFRPVECR